MLMASCPYASKDVSKTKTDVYEAFNKNLLKFKCDFFINNYLINYLFINMLVIRGNSLGL